MTDFWYREGSEFPRYRFFFFFTVFQVCLKEGLPFCIYLWQGLQKHNKGFFFYWKLTLETNPPDWFNLVGWSLILASDSLDWNVFLEHHNIWWYILDESSVTKDLIDITQLYVLYILNYDEPPWSIPRYVILHWVIIN